VKLKKKSFAINISYGARKLLKMEIKI